MSKVLVTGGCGFIGSHIADRLLRKGHEVAIADNLSTGSLDNVKGMDVNIYHCDLLSDAFGRAVEHFRPDCIVHQAAQASVFKSTENMALDEAVNIQGTIKVIEAAKDYGVRKIVYAASAAIYGDPDYLPIDEGHQIGPNSPYGISKYVAEMYLRLAGSMFGLDYTMLRYSNVYGPRQNVIGEGGAVAKFTQALRTGSPIIVHGDGEQSRDFVYVGDVAEANAIALTEGSRETVHISTGVQTSINRLIEIMLLCSGRKRTVLHQEPRPGDIRHSVLSNAKAAEKLGWTPAVTLEEGVRRTLGYYGV
ncbi:NAD-dependent epimerase/dehydratase family protein [Paenibacillus sp. MBLB4367]|uniref:NAD-dependent epimerase/dehydratase family protein n=1 Tax=Paenibacillus sp. MBLB4367 TaxID=3384767 RepID=UPI003908193A